MAIKPMVFFIVIAIVQPDVWKLGFW